MKEYASLVCEIGRRMYAKGLVSSHDGNISVRLEDGNIMVTPTMVSKGFMKEEDMALVTPEGCIVSGTKKPSSELLMHLAVYKERRDIKGIVHAHPFMACVFAVLGRAVDMKYMPEAVNTLGVIPLAPYAEPGTEDLAKSVAPFVKKYNGALLANHGAITWANDLTAAYYLMEQLEFYCRVAAEAERMGLPRSIG